jgi:hypothetical protein
VLRKLDGYCHYLVDVNYKDALSQWCIKEQTIYTIAKHIQRIWNLPNQDREIFSIVAILISFCTCHLQTNNLNKLFFVNKNWLTILPIGCLKHVDLATRCEVKFNLITNWRLNLKMAWNVSSP